tara:strand:+ start:2382 stop:2897 length:516 start_codon:yes stop_codon:yes gene_type:complete
MNNKKTILHFTLAVALIVGIFVTAKLRPTSASSSNYLSNLDYNIEIKDDLVLNKGSLDENEVSINDIQDNNKNIDEADILCEDCEDAIISDNISTERTISDIRYNFDVSNTDQVKEVQKILGLEQDGIFGPKTSAAYQAAIFGDGPKKTYAEDNSKKNEESPLSTTNAMLD